MSSTPEVRAVLTGLLPWTAVDAVEVGRQDRRGTVLTMLNVTPAAGGPVQRLVLKQYRPGDEEGDGTWAAHVGQALEATGMRAPAPDRVALSLAARPGALLCEHAPGVSWRATVGTADGERAAAAVGRWVAALQSHRVDAPVGTRRGPGGARLQLDALLLLDAPPPGRVAAVGERVLAGLAEPQPLVLAHGNLHPDNLFVDVGAPGLVVTAIDLDTAARREPAYDVGYGVAQLVIRSLRRPGRDHGERAARAFLDGYRTAEGLAPDDRIALQAARAVLQALHYEAVGMRQPARAQEFLLPFLEGLVLQGLDVLSR